MMKAVVKFGVPQAALTISAGSGIDSGDGIEFDTPEAAADAAVKIAKVLMQQEMPHPASNFVVGPDRPQVILWNRLRSAWVSVSFDRRCTEQATASLSVQTESVI
ncbi:MAG: hypothetical protein FD131_4772 [Rhodocyclaceae bacterium]|nr:MAG: hypothetical protein FD131_4772 [Rhodocyclaceae bacterium]